MAHRFVCSTNLMYDETYTHANVIEWPNVMQYGERDLFADGDLITVVYKLGIQPAH